MLIYYLQLALKSLRKTPLLTLLMVMTLSVGQAASMITLTLRHALAADPIPGKSELLLVPRAVSDGGGPYDGMFTYAQSRAMAEAVRPSLMLGQALGSISSSDHTKSISGQPIRFTTRNFFSFFDVPLASGRIWSKEEDQRGDPVVVLNSRIARKLFPATDPIGASVNIGDASYRVIGVIDKWDPAPRFYDMSIGSFMRSDQAFLPLASVRTASADLGVPRLCVGGASAMPPSHLLDDDCSWLTPWFLAEGRAAVPALTRHVSAAARFVLRDTGRTDFSVLDVRQLLAGADVVPASVDVFTALGLAFLILCIINAAGMQLSRLLRRVAQTGIRRALGARRRDIVGQYLCETLLIGFGSGLLDIVLTEAGLYWVRQLDSFYTRTASTDPATAAMAISLMTFCCLLTGMAPAWVASRTDPALAIKVQA